MTGQDTTAGPVGRPLYGAMRDLTPQERRDWQRTTLATAPRDYAWEGRLQFWLEDVVFGKARTLPKFWARELIARTPYLSWEQAAYVTAGKLHDHSARARRLYDNLTEVRAEQDNELWHLLILKEVIVAHGVRQNPVRFRFLPQLIAFAVAQEFWFLKMLNPLRSYRVNADIEDHAEHEYAALALEHPEWEDHPFPSAVAPAYAVYESLADLFRQIGSDEGLHKELSLARVS